MMATLLDDMTTPQPSRLAVTCVGDREVAAVGTIDSHTADDLLTQLHDLGTEADATLNLGAVEFIDSSGLRAIVTAHQDFERGESKLVLADPSESVQRLLEITGLVDHLHFA